MGLFMFSACKEEKKVTENEVRGEISEKLEEAGLYKKSSNSDEQIAALNVVYKSSYESLGPINHEILQSWTDHIKYEDPEKLYDDMFASFNLSEQVGSLVKEYSNADFSSYYDRDVYNQTIALLFSKENKPDEYKHTVDLFTKVADVAGKTLQNNNVSIDVTDWNKGMTKNFAEYWYVHASRILAAANAAGNTTLNEFLQREAS